MDRETLFLQSTAHKKLFEKIRNLCLSFPGTNERISHGAPTFFINDKHTFAQYHVNHHGDGRIALWCPAPTGMQSILIQDSPELYFRPPYVGHLGWIGVNLDKNAAWKDISGIIEDAYLSKAPKKYKEKLLGKERME